MITQVNIFDTEWFRVDCDNCNETLFNEETEQCLMPDTLSVNILATNEGWLIKRTVILKWCKSTSMFAQNAKKI